MQTPGQGELQAAQKRKGHAQHQRAADRRHRHYLHAEHEYLDSLRYQTTDRRPGCEEDSRDASSGNSSADGGCLPEAIGERRVYVVSLADLWQIVLASIDSSL